MLRRWGLAAFVFVIGVLLVLSFARTEPVGAALEGTVMLALTWGVSPWFFPRPVSVVDARRLSADDGAPVVFWRPGCRYCLRLRLRLGTAAQRLHWVDIWCDPEAAAELREHTGGDETVPTVLVDGQAHVNPDPGWVRRLAVSGTAARPGGSSS